MFFEGIEILCPMIYFLQACFDFDGQINLLIYRDTITWISQLSTQKMNRVARLGLTNHVFDSILCLNELIIPTSYC